jgi:hypothetical protein
VTFLPSNPWIHQPFEEYDTLRPHNLAAWLKRGKRASLLDDDSAA